MEVSYSMVFPARLRIVHAGETKFFTTPQDVWDWVEQQGPQDRRHDGRDQPEKDQTRSPGRGGKPKCHPTLEEGHRDRESTVAAIAYLRATSLQGNPPSQERTRETRTLMPA